LRWPSVLSLIISPYVFCRGNLDTVEFCCAHTIRLIISCTCYSHSSAFRRQ
jgi:hypothetical protein